MQTSNVNHPTIDQLSEFVAGSLPMSRALCISAHIEHCEQCKQQVNQLTALGTLQLESIKDAPSEPKLLQQVMQRIRSQKPETATTEVAPETLRDAFIPRCLSQLVKGSIDNLNWLRVSGSVKLASLCTDTNGSKLALVRIKAGGKMAHHHHTDDEITVVLKGSYSDADGVYKAGDYIFRDTQHKHKPVASIDSECICLITMDGPIEFTGLFYRLFNPLLRRNHAV